MCGQKSIVGVTPLGNLSSVITRSLTLLEPSSDISSSHKTNDFDWTHPCTLNPTPMRPESVDDEI